MGKSQRDKGAAGERELRAELFRQLGECVSERILGQARDGGFDIQIGEMIAVEGKRQERARIHTWLTQAEAATVRGAKRMSTDPYLPAVAWRPNRRGWVVAMTLDDWCSLVREALPDPQDLKDFREAEAIVEKMRGNGPGKTTHEQLLRLIEGAKE